MCLQGPLSRLGKIGACLPQGCLCALFLQGLITRLRIPPGPGAQISSSDSVRACLQDDLLDIPNLKGRQPSPKLLSMLSPYLRFFLTQHIQGVRRMHRLIASKPQERLFNFKASHHHALNTRPIPFLVFLVGVRFEDRTQAHRNTGTLPRPQRKSEENL